MKTTIKKYGLYAFTIALVFFFLALYFGKGLSFATQEVIGYVSMAVCLLPVYFGIKHHRDYENNGSINFKEGFVIGLLITLCAAIGFAIIDFLFVSYINPEFPQQYLAYSIENINASTVSAEEKLTEIENAKEMMETYGTPAFGALLMFSMVFIFGIIVSLLSAVTLQRKSS